MPKEFVKFLFLFLVAFLFDNYAIENSGEYVDFLLCRGCGHEIVDPSHITHIPSKVAHRQRNDTISGQNGTLIQLFKNPDGMYFEVITAMVANVNEASKPSDMMTWFPGYHWTICVCPRCMKHLGWQYHATSPQTKPSPFLE
uniref:Uncharacterized protein LOC111123868 n=1 Tax=Crassostrea virginica TaxID=6565 RepID=A0A8B8D5W0_CRAVI|nr:uncharacterized protein LOC111123868 [Crassostrea virginica]